MVRVYSCMTYRYYVYRTAKRLWLLALLTVVFGACLCWKVGRMEGLENGFLQSADAYGSTKNVFLYHDGWPLSRMHGDVLEIRPGMVYNFAIRIDQQILELLPSQSVRAQGNYVSPEAVEEVMVQLRFPKALRAGETCNLGVALFPKGLDGDYNAITLSSDEDVELYIVSGWQGEYYHAGQLFSYYSTVFMATHPNGVIIKRPHPLLPETEWGYDEWLKFSLYVGPAESEPSEEDCYDPVEQWLHSFPVQPADSNDIDSIIIDPYYVAAAK